MAGTDPAEGSPGMAGTELAEGRPGSEPAEGSPGMAGTELAEGRPGSEPAEGSPGMAGTEPPEGRLGAPGRLGTPGRLGKPVVHTVRPLFDEAVTDPPPCELVTLPDPSVVMGIGSAGVAGVLSHCDPLGTDVEPPGKVGSDPAPGSGDTARSDVGFGSDGVVAGLTLAPLGNAPTTPSATAVRPAAPAAIVVTLFFTFIFPLV
jgi:hypothetical protein